MIRAGMLVSSEFTLLSLPWLDFLPVLRHKYCMRYDQKPVHRKLIVPWSDSNGVCIAMLISMVVVLVFAIIGLTVAFGIPEHRRYFWVPTLLLVFSLTVITLTARRLIKRFKYRYSKDIF